MMIEEADARDIGFIEDFSLADDRKDALKQLVPGSTEYYYYSCLHAQNSGDFKKVDQLVNQWIKRDGYSAKVKEIMNRQAVLVYDRSPEKSLAHIQRELGLRFDHQKSTAHGHVDYPSTLDQNSISIATLMSDAFSNHENLEGLEQEGLDFLDVEKLDPGRRRDLLNRIELPDLPNLPELVVADLKTKHSGGFGSLGIHYKMTRSQLDACLRLAPDLLSVTNFVQAYITQLAPSDDTDIQYDKAQRKAYLERLWQFVKELKPAHNSLKAHVLFHLLDDHRSSGDYDLKEVRQRFMTYLKIPRQVAYIDPSYVKHASRRNVRAVLTENFGPYSLLPQVGSDQELVRDYLSHYFVTEKHYKAYAKYIRDDYLQLLFAETKIVNGIGDMEQWYAMIPPAAYQALKERVDLDFATTNKRYFAANEPVKLSLFVKNVPNLIVKVFEINTFNYYRDNHKQIDTAIELDGLVATRENVIDYDDPPLRRICRDFNFPGIDKAGVYVIEFIGNGKSSRVAIRKGNLYYLDQIGPDGHEFTIYDGSNQPRPHASIHMAGRQFKPDDDGVIVIPFTQKPMQQDIIIKDKDDCVLSSFYHKSEQYDLKAGFYVDRESLMKREKAQVLVRPMLGLNGYPVSLSLLEHVRLTLVSTNIDGVTTTKEITGFELFEDKESIVEFQVPENLQSLGFTLRAKVKNVSRHKKEDLIASVQFSVNSIDKTLSVEDLHLSRQDSGYLLELLGKNGESNPNRPVNIELKHRYFTETVHASLQTDDGGRVDLGRLEGILWIRAEGPEGIGHTWHLTGDAYQYPTVIHARAQEVLRIPYVGSESQGQGRLHYALFERRGRALFQDLTEAVKIKDGFMVIGGLAAGNYELHLKESDTLLQLRLTRGKAREPYIMSENRVLEVINPHPLHIQSAEINRKRLVVQLANPTDDTRVHLFATRFFPAHHPFTELNVVRPIQPNAVQLTKPVSQYVAGRNIGDEYRYILDRAHTDKFPGNMLDRPQLLLNPWSIRKTETAVVEAEPGEAYESLAAPAARSLMERESPGKPLQKAATPEPSTNIDFLSSPSIVKINLKPDEHGRITIDRKTLGHCLQVHVVAVNQHDTIYRQVALDGQSMKTRELRQVQGFDPEKHFGEQKKATSLTAGETFELEDMTTSEFQIYDALKKVYDFMMTAKEDPTLREFAFILTWPDLTSDEKLDHYTKYACHELNVFLYHKDRDFFDRVIMPYLKHKKDKTFVDRWLLGDDLKRYLKPWAYGRLNIAEKILLAGRYPDESKGIKRDVKDRFDMIPPDVDQFNRLFDMALRGRDLSEDDGYGFDDAKDKALDRMLASGAVLGASEKQAMIAEPESIAPEEAPFDRDDGSIKKRKSRRLKSRRKHSEKRPGFFQKLDKTREWAENNYYKRPIAEQNADLIKTNAFWMDYASHSGSRPFCSKHFVYATRNFSEMMLALAVLDLPFKPAEHKTDIDKLTFSLKAGSPAIIFHKEIHPAKPAAEKSPILVNQNYFQSTDPFIYDGNEQQDKFVRDEFLYRTAYGCQVVVGNPTSSRKKLRLLMQIPNGAIPVQSGFYTKSIPISLDPFSTRKFEYHFYFPQAGKFKHYPVQVSENEAFVTSADPWTMNVVEAFTQLDETSWDYISQNGSENSILRYIEKHNLNRIDLEKIAFRMRDRNFFTKTIQTLKDRHFYHPTLWSYGLMHKDPAATSEFLQHSAFAGMCGEYLSSSLLTIDPVERKTYQHLEYRPLVNARVHQLGGRRKILNDRFHEQYHRLMKVLSYRSELTNEDLMDVTHYLLAQDRIKEAFGFFKRIASSKLAAKIQYDYLHLYFDFYMGNISQARAIAAKYENHPVLKWRNMFRHALNQLDELDGQTAQEIDQQSRDQRHARIAAEETSFDFNIESRTVTLQYQNMTSCRVNYYPMDIELLFSGNPFVQQDTGYFTYIRPNHSQSVELPKDQSIVTFDLPDQFHNSNLMVEIEAGGIKKSTVYYANSLDVQVMENYGQLRVIHQTTREPLHTTYIKTYARMHDGSIKFFKDGYTDLRGRFDYLSLNTSELDAVDKFAILILNEDYGAIVREAAPPKR